MALRQLWPAGTLNPASVSSPLTRLGMSRSSFYDHDDDERLAAHDALRAAVRSMGYMGMSGHDAAAGPRTGGPPQLCVIVGLEVALVLQVLSLLDQCLQAGPPRRPSAA